MDILETPFVSYECLKDVFCMLWMSKRRLLYVMDVSRTSFVCYKCPFKMSLACYEHLKDVFSNVYKMSSIRYEGLNISILKLLPTFHNLFKTEH